MLQNFDKLLVLGDLDLSATTVYQIFSVGKFLWVTLYIQYLHKSSSSAYIKQSHILAWDMGGICFMSWHNKADRPENSFPALFAYRTWRGIFRTVTIIKLFVSVFYFSPGEEICVCVSAVWCRCTTMTKGAFDLKELTAKCDVYIYFNITETLCPMELYHCYTGNVSIRCQLFTNELAVSLHVQCTPIKGFFL